MSRIIAALFTFTIACTAHAQSIDLTYHAPDEPRGEHLRLSSAKQLRASGIVITLAGVVASIVGAVGIGTYVRSDDQLDHTNLRDLGIGGFVSGAVAIGAGSGMWAFGDYEVRRAEGRAPMLDPSLRAHRGHSLTVAGATLTALGVALTVFSFVPAVAAPPGNGDGWASYYIGSAAMGGAGSVLLGAGIPLLAVGKHERRFSIDAVGPQGQRGGGSVGLSGRF